MEYKTKELKNKSLCCCSVRKIYEFINGLFQTTKTMNFESIVTEAYHS